MPAHTRGADERWERARKCGLSPSLVSTAEAHSASGGDGTGEENQLFLSLASRHGALLRLTVLLSGFLKGFLNFFSKQPLLGCGCICMLEGSWLTMWASREPSSQSIPIEAEMKQSP